MNHNLFETYIRKAFHITDINKSIRLDIDLFGQENLLKYLVKECCDAYISVYNRQEIPEQKLAIEFINLNDMNAIAINNEDCKAIGVCIGSIMKIYHEALLLCSLNDFFPSIGNTNDCLNTINFFEVDEPEIIPYSNEFYQIAFYSGPEDSIRQNLALLITIMAEEFIIFHELGHHLDGHLSYLVDYLGLSSLKAQGNDSEIEFSIYQTLEMDADAFAIQLLLDNVYRKKEYYGQMLNHTLSKTDLIMMLSCASTLVFLLMDNKNDLKCNLLMSNYLPRHYRLFLIKVILGNQLKTKYADFLMTDNCTETIITSSLHLETLYNRIHGVSNDNLEYKEQVHQRVEQYYTDVIEHTWSELRPILSIYSHIKLAD